MQFPLYAVGIDLAWSPRKPTGGAVLRVDAAGAQLLGTALLGSDAEIAGYVAQAVGEHPCLVCVDAPLWVPNTTGRRPGEAELATEFARYQAGAHPANRQRLAFDGVVRGEALVEALAAQGIVHRPAIAAEVLTRQVTEVFPHPAMIALFGLQRTLKYKLKATRSRAEVDTAWQEYQGHLAALAHADPPLHGHEELVAQPVAALRGRALKHYEDQIDALMCAYIGVYAFRWGAARCRVFGSMEGGYIFTPVPPALWPAGGV